MVISALASELRQDTGRAGLPGTLDEVITAAERTEGVRLGQLITALQPDRQAIAAALAAILQAAAGTDPGQDAPVTRDHAAIIQHHLE